MISFITLIHLLLLGSLFFFSYPFYELLIAPLINIVMLWIIITRLGFKYAVERLTCGEILPTLLYIIWLCIFPQAELIYIIPIFLSSIGKTYLLCTSPNELQIDMIQSLIVLQAKVEIVVIIHHFFKVLSVGLPYKVIQLLLLLAIFKLKYTIHYGTRKAYSEIHFGLDRFAKSLGMRGSYHSAHRLISLLGNGIWKDTKRITY